MSQKSTENKILFEIMKMFNVKDFSSTKKIKTLQRLVSCNGLMLKERKRREVGGMTCKL